MIIGRCALLTLPPPDAPRIHLALLSLPSSLSGQVRLLPGQLTALRRSEKQPKKGVVLE